MKAKLITDTVTIEITLSRRDLEDLPDALKYAAGRMTLEAGATPSQAETVEARRELLSELIEALEEV